MSEVLTLKDEKIIYGYVRLNSSQNKCLPKDIMQMCYLYCKCNVELFNSYYNYLSRGKSNHKNYEISDDYLIVENSAANLSPCYGRHRISIKDSYNLYTWIFRIKHISGQIAIGIAKVSGKVFTYYKIHYSLRNDGNTSRANSTKEITEKSALSYKENDTVSMTLDLKNGTLTYTVNNGPEYIAFSDITTEGKIDYCMGVTLNGIGDSLELLSCIRSIIGVLPHSTEINTEIYPHLQTNKRLPGNYMISSELFDHSFYKYNNENKGFEKICDIKFNKYNNPDTMEILGCNKKATEISAIKSWKYCVYSIKHAKWQKKWKIEFPRYDLVARYRLFKTGRFIHIFCTGAEYGSTSYWHHIWDKKTQFLLSKTYQEEQNLVRNIVGLNSDSRFYTSKLWNIIYCITIPHSDIIDTIFVYYCRLNDIIDKSNPNKYEWESVSMRVPPECEQDASQWRYTLCSVYDTVILLFHLSQRNVYYRNLLFMNEWTKLEDNLPDIGTYAISADVRVTDDNMVHFIQNPTRDGDQYCISLDLKGVLPSGVKMDSDAIMMLIDGFVMNKTGYQDVVDIIFNYFCTLT